MTTCKGFRRGAPAGNCALQEWGVGCYEGTVCLVVLPPQYGPSTVQWEAKPTVRRLRRRREILRWGAC